MWIDATGSNHLDERNAREWSSVAGGGVAGPVMRRVTDPERIAELDDARAVRLERQEKAAQFHPLDPARERGISESPWRSEEHTSELQSLMRSSYAVFCLKKKTTVK